jgi:serine protease Do
MNNDNFNSYNNNNQNYNPYGGYNGYYGNYPGGNIPNPKKEKKHGGRTLALVLVGAILGAVIGGGGIGLYLSNGVGSLSSALTAQQQSYINKAVSNSVASALSSSSSNSEKLSSTTSVDYSSDIQSVAKAVMPSVVGVKTEITQQNFFGSSSQGESVGTGIVVSSDGLVLTNQHVVSDNPSAVTVTLIDGTEHTAKVLFADSTMDLAVIKIDATGLTAATLGDSDNISIGQVAIAIGNPYGLEYQRSVTAGIVSAVNRSIQLSQLHISENLIQTDAAINSGNSGGPLLNEKGEVVGINSYKLSDGEGMGFAIPVSAAKPIIDQIIKTGTFTQAQIGATFIDKEYLTYYDFNGLKLDSGLYVYSVEQSSDAYSKGLKTGDVITKVNGTEVNTVLELKQLLYGHAPGDTVTLTVQRSGNTSDMVSPGACP